MPDEAEEQLHLLAQDCFRRVHDGLTPMQPMSQEAGAEIGRELTYVAYERLGLLDNLHEVGKEAQSQA